MARPPFFDPLEARGNRAEAVIEYEPRGCQGRAPIVGEGAAYRCPVPAYDLGFRIIPACALAFPWTHPPDTLFQCLLGMTVSVIDGLCGLAERMQVTKLVWELGEGLGHGAAERELAIGEEPHDRHPYGLPHLRAEGCQVLVGRREQAAREEHHACEAIPQDPQDCMPDLGLETIEGQHDLPLGRGEALEAGGVGERQSKQFVVSLQEVQHCAGGDDDAAALELVMALGHTPVLGIAQRPDEGDDIPTKLVFGECQTAFLLRAVGGAHLRASWIGTAPYLERAA